MTLSIRKIIVGITGCLASTLASATIIYDFSPDATGAEILQNRESGPVSNISNGVNWLDEPNPSGASLAHPVRITGMDIYTRIDYVEKNTKVLIKYVTLGAAGPVLSSFETVISAIDYQGIITGPDNAANDPNDIFKDQIRAFADFGSNTIDYAGGFFAIGMSGLNSNIGAYILDFETGITDPNRDGLTPGYNDLERIAFNGNGDLAFRLHGTTLVPDSGNALVGLGFALFGMLAIRKFRSK